jgi:hypothetical protein
VCARACACVYMRIHELLLRAPERWLAHVCVCVNMNVNGYLCAHVCVCVCVYEGLCTNVCVRVHICVCMRAIYPRTRNMLTCVLYVSMKKFHVDIFFKSPYRRLRDGLGTVSMRAH